jgi:hypothetical protein
VQPADVHGHPLHHQSRALPHRFVAPGRKLIEELLVTIDWPGWARRPELIREKSGLTQASF